MKKTFPLILLTFLTIGLFRPITALAEEQKLPSGIDRNQVGQKIEDYVKKHDFTIFGKYRIGLGALLIVYALIKAIIG